MNIKSLSVLLSALCLFSVLSGCGFSGNLSTTTIAEPNIPSNYTTYTDEQGLFSISYPNDWEPMLSIMEEAMNNIKDIINSSNKDIPIEKATMIFVAGLLSEQDSYLPNVNIMIEPMPLLVRNHNQLIEAEVSGVKSTITDYNEISRTKTTVDGREATIIEWEGTYPQIGWTHPFQLFLLVGRNGWCITCTAPEGEVDKWESDFQSVARSLRILK
jgi:hypothetical protein